MKVIIMKIWLKKKIFFVLPSFPEKAKNKKQSRDRDDLSLMTKIHKAKALNKFNSVLGGTKGIFLKNIKQQTNILTEQISSRKNINKGPKCS